MRAGKTNTPFGYRLVCPRFRPRSKLSLLFTRALNLSFLRFLWFCRRCAAWFRRRCIAWFRRRCTAWFRRESTAALRMVLGRRVLCGWTRRRRVGPIGNDIFKPAAARTTGEQRTQNRYYKNTHHDGGFPEDIALPLSNCEWPHEIEQSQVTKARCIKLSPIHVSKDEQRQSPPRPLMMFQIWRECQTHGIERSAHGFQGFGIVDIPDVAEWGHFVLTLSPCKRRSWAGGTTT
jgi:hypothetical protein